MAVGKVMKSSGFTLIELLVTIAVIVILATIAVPNFQTLIATNRQAAEYNKVLSGFHLARTEAVKKREVVSVVIENTSGKWVMDVKESGGGLIKRVESKDGLINVDSVNVGFDSLGRLEGCKDGGGSDISPCVVSVGSVGIEINAAGNIDKAD